MNFFHQIIHKGREQASWKKQDKGHSWKIQSSTYMLDTHWEWYENGKGLQKYKWKNYKDNTVYAPAMVPANLATPKLTKINLESFKSHVPLTQLGHLNPDYWFTI